MFKIFFRLKYNYAAGYVFEIFILEFCTGYFFQFFIIFDNFIFFDINLFFKRFYKQLRLLMQLS